MNSDFLDKFKGKTNKVPKGGVSNILDASNKITSKQRQIKKIDGKPHTTEKQKKSKRKKDKISPSGKQNIKTKIQSSCFSEPKKLKNLSTGKSKQILILKQSKKPLQISTNLKKPLLKLPKISKQNVITKIDSVRQPLQRSNIIQKPKKTIFTQIRQQKTHKQHNSDYFESILDQDALLQLRRLNQLQIIVKQQELKRQNSEEQPYLKRSYVSHKKGNTIHY